MVTTMFIKAFGKQLLGKNYHVNEKLETLKDRYAIAAKKTARWSGIYRIFILLKILCSKYSRSHFTCKYCKNFYIANLTMATVVHFFWAHFAYSQFAYSHFAY